MSDNINLLVPPYLQTLGYCDILCIQKISEKCFKEDGAFHPYWVEWRGIFDYLSCIEYSKQSIDNLPKGAELLYSFCDVQAKYNSASLIFFSQATDLSPLCANRCKTTIKNNLNQNVTMCIINW